MSTIQNTAGRDDQLPFDHLRHAILRDNRQLPRPPGSYRLTWEEFHHPRIPLGPISHYGYNHS